MILTPKQIEELNEAAQPLMTWLGTNCHPHCKVIVESDSAEIVEGLAIVKAGCCGHKSDCAIHNEPAFPAGACDCKTPNDQAEL